MQNKYVYQNFNAFRIILKALFEPLDPICVIQATEHTV